LTNHETEAASATNSLQHSKGRLLSVGETLKYAYLLAIGGTLSLGAFAQANSQESIALVPIKPIPTYSVSVTSRTVEAVNYEHRSGATNVSFAGTNLMPSADGQAKVRSKRGTMEVEATFGSLQSPSTFGGEYLTYVLWAISPDGHAVNLGEVLLGGNERSKLTATTNLQAFALIVTAEPYFAVGQPSNVVVLENVIRDDTRGTTEAVNAKYELMERGGYIPTGYKFDPVVLDAKLPLEFLEARNALRIAKSEGAEQYASASYLHASDLMSTADGYAGDGPSERKRLISTSRETVQTAEDAREISMKKMDEVRRTDERIASENAQALSQAQANDANRRKDQALMDATAARANASDALAQLSISETTSTAAITSAQADADRSRVDATAARASASDALAQMAINETTSKAAISSAQADADQSRMIADQAQQNEHQANAEKASMRAQLSEQLNKILATRDSARGLIVSMSDVLFDTGQFSLKPGAREKLAKVAGILIAYPGLNIAVGGYTDNVGGDAMNQKLSENRAWTVRDYLIGQGVAAKALSATGFGNSSPVTSNDNSAGRQENRRVELVVSGDAIGSPVSVMTGSLR
jgi:outer membrane protein OmpA-like peptidoglycan-associated protein